MEKPKWPEEIVECPNCGKEVAVAGSVPSMAGYGVDWWIKCPKCGYEDSGHPDVS